MVDFTLFRNAVRARIVNGLVVCSTGATNLSATALGYARVAGSFRTDKFGPGMEIDTAGFGVAGNNGKAIVSGVEDLLLYIEGGRTAEGAAGARTVSVALPSRRYWENRKFEPDAGFPYVEEDLQPGSPPKLRGMTNGGDVETLPLYILRVYGLANVGTYALETYADKILRLFPAGYAIVTSDGSVFHVRTDTMASRGPVSPDKPGFSVCTITIPFRSQSLNPPAA